MPITNTPRLAIAAALTTLTPAAANAANVDFPRYPAISPDGSQITFSWSGDIFLANLDPSSPTIQATRLTNHPLDELYSTFSANGDAVLFTSEQTGTHNVFTIDTDGTDAAQLTRTDRPFIISKHHPTQPAVLGHARREGDLYRASRPYTASTNSGRINRLHDAFGNLPVASPDASLIVFERGGSSWHRRHYRGPDSRNLFLYDTAAETFHQLTNRPGNDGFPRFKDADTVLFLSDRELDTVNIYQANINPDNTLDQSSLRRVTSFQGKDVQWFDVDTRGRTAVLHVWDTLYTIDLNSSRPPQPLTIAAPADLRDDITLINTNAKADDAALSPDGKTIAFIAHGDLFIRATEDDAPVRRVSNALEQPHARERNPAWSPDGLRLYFQSDHDGTESIYAATVNTTREELKARVSTTLGVEEDNNNTTDKTDTTTNNNNNNADADADNTTENEAANDEPAEEDRPPHLDPSRWHDAVRFNIAPAVLTDNNDHNPRPLPDGVHLSFQRERGDIIVRNLVTGDEHTILENWDTFTDWRFTADGQYTVYATQDLDHNADVFITPTLGPNDNFPSPVNLTMHPDNDYLPRISADGRVLAFVSERAGEQYDVYTVFLDADLDDLPEADLDAYFEQAAEAAKELEPIEPVDLNALREAHSQGETPDLPTANGPAANINHADLETAYLRVRRLTNDDGNEWDLELTPDATRVIFNANTDDGRKLISLDRKRDDRKVLSNQADVTGFSTTSNTAVIVQSGKPGTADPNGELATYDTPHTLRIDLQAQASQKFNEAARTLGLSFYHPTMKGLDWPQLSREYQELATQTRTADEFAHVARRFLGELNASHLGVYPPAPDSDISQPSGRLGIDHTTLPQPDGTVHARVERVIFNAPAADTVMALKPGDTITRVELEPIKHSLEHALQGRVAEETIITVKRPAENLADQNPTDNNPTDNNPTDNNANAQPDTVTLDLLITPISYRAEAARRYTDWTIQRREQVEQLSDGRLGYLHIRSMGAGSLEDFERDLFAAAYGKDGLIIDVRNNPGGWITDRLLTSIMARPHAYTIPRGADNPRTDAYPQDRLYIQRYTKPINLLINEKSFSNAEIFAHAFNALERGTTVGVQTYGGVISTGAFTLVDGTRVRRPFRGWYLKDGTDMENNGAIPDIRIPQTPEDEAANKDRQLETAVRELLNRIDAQNASTQNDQANPRHAR